MRRAPLRSKPEPTIALINIVFLMLIFFMVAGTLAPPLDPEVTLVDTSDLDSREPADALIITSAGSLRYRGNPVSDPSAYLSDLTTNTKGDQAIARVMPDRDAPAETLLRVARDLRAGGADKVVIVTEKALQ